MVRSDKKRKEVTGKSSLHGNKKRRSSVDKEFAICKLINEHGFVIATKADEHNQINVDQFTFQQNVERALQKYSTQELKQLTDSLEHFWEDGIRFCLSLLPTDSSDSCSYSSRGKQQESLARLLLGIEKLQNPVANLLLEKIPEVTFNKDLSESASKLGDLNVVHRIVCQIRWLDCIYNRKELLNKIIEVVTVSELPTQQELVCCLSEVVDDENQDEVAKKLQQMLLENCELVSCVLDALNNIKLKGELLIEIRESVLKIIQSVNLGELPAVLKFLLNSAQEYDAFELVNNVRSKLQLGCDVGLPRHSSTPHQRKTLQNNNKDNEALIFDTLKSGIRFNRLLGDAWSKVLEAISCPKQQKIIDVFVFITLYSLKHKRRSLNTLLRNKVKAGIFTEDNVSAALNTNHEVYHSSLKELLLVSEILLRAADSSVSSYGGNMYKEIFRCFDVYSQQEVVAALVTHIGSGYEHEVEAAFTVLRSLVDENPAKMVTFVVILKGTLDYLENLNISQLRCLIGMVSKLTTEVNKTSVDDEMFMIVRKQLSSTNIRYKRIGVVGGLAILANIFDVNQSSLQDTNGADEMLESDFQEVINLLKLITSNVKKNSEATSLFYDELTIVIKKRNPNKKILSWVFETVVGEFHDDYLIDSNEVKSNDSEYRKLVYDLDGPQEGGIAVDLYPHSVQSDHSESSSESVKVDKWSRKMVVLPAQFRLISHCERKMNDGSLDGINALLGCPLLFCSEQTFERVWTMDEDERRRHCIAVCHAINWIRELLNCFSAETVDTDEEGKILARIKTMVKLSKHLEKVLAITKNIQLPVLDFSIDDHLLETVQPVTSTKEAPKKPRKSPKQTNNSKDDNEGSCIAEENDDVTKKKEKHTDTIIPLLRFPASFRQLDLCVFYSLSYKAVSKIFNATGVSEEIREEIKLSPENINYLLEDLVRKLEYSLSANKRSFLKRSSAKIIGFSNLPCDLDVVKFMIHILATLCQHHLFCKQYFITLKEQSDEVVDGSQMFSEESHNISTMLIQLLRCYGFLLQWEGFHHGRNQRLLKDVLTVLANSLGGDKCDGNSGVNKLVKVVFTNFLPKDWFPISINIAVHIYKLSSSIAGHAEDSKNYFKKQKEELLLKFLKQTWYEPSGEKEKGSKFNESLCYLIRSYIKETVDPLEVMNELCNGLISYMVNYKEKGDHSDSTISSLNKASMIAFYRGVFEELVSFIKTQSLLPNQRNHEIIAEKLPAIQKALLVFQALNALLKEVGNNRLFLMASLKYSKLFLESFLKSSMPLLDLTLRTQKDMVHSILRTAQQSTRSLQHLCSHSKISKDVSLTTHVPGLKKCLETFVFRVKAVLAYNNCDGVFWLGNLKNRDLQGNEIASQVAPCNGNEEEDEEDSHANDVEENDEYSESF